MTALLALALLVIAPVTDTTQTGKISHYASGVMEQYATALHWGTAGRVVSGALRTGPPWGSTAEMME